MKKLVFILVVLSVVFGSCASPVDEPDVVEPAPPVAKVNPFEGVWQSTAGYITIRRGNTISDSSGTIIGTYTYNDTYYYRYQTGNLSHIYITYRYEFKDNGNMLYLYWEPNVYGVVASDGVLQKIGD